MDLQELLDLLARWHELSDDERTTLHEGLTTYIAEHADLDDLDTIRTQLLAATDAMLDAEQTDDVLDALTWTAEVMDQARTRTTEIESADAERDQRAQELAERIRGEQASDGDGDDDGGEDGDGDESGDGEGEGDDDDASGSTEGDGDDDGEGAGDEESSEQREPVAASAGRASPGAARGNRRGQRRPSGQRRSFLTAAAGVPDFALGQRVESRLDRALAFQSTLDALEGSPNRGRVPVLRSRAQWDDDAFLDRNGPANLEKIERVTSLEAITAAGGICAPPTPRYDHPNLSTDERPVRDALVRFGADRGGVIIPGALQLADVAGASTVWTAANDANPTDPTTKPCLRVECGDDETITIDAIYRCLEFGNFNARTWPERVDRVMQLAAAAHARLAETRLLERISALSTAVTYGPILGSARDVLTMLDVLIAGTRSRHRMSPRQPLRFLLPFWFRDQMRADLAREIPGATSERLATADATIDSFFAARQVNVTWHLDGEVASEQVMPAQGPGVINGWPAAAIGHLFPEGMFLFLDGGQLDFGVVRDSTLNATNDFQVAVEDFENVARHGPGEAFEVTLEVCPDGATSGTRDLACEDSLAS
jgi:hypothetical protein